MKKPVALLTICTIATTLALTSACTRKSPDSTAPAASQAPATTAPTPATAPVTDTAKSDATITTPGAGGLTPQQISDAVSKTVCKRMTTCNPQGGSETDCVSGLSKDMASNLSDNAKAVTQAQLDGCIASITKATCEQLSAPTPPAGCEFMN